MKGPLLFLSDPVTLASKGMPDEFFLLHYFVHSKSTMASDGGEMKGAQLQFLSHPLEVAVHQLEVVAAMVARPLSCAGCLPLVEIVSRHRPANCG